MKVLILYKNIYNIPKAFEEILKDDGIECVLLQFQKAEETRQFIKKNGISAVVSSEINVLSKCKVDGVSRIFLSADYCASEKLGNETCDLCLIPSKELMFDFVNSGAKDKTVNSITLPVRRKLKDITDKETACKKLGIESEKLIFCVFTKNSTKREVKATLKAISELCPEFLTIVLTSTDSEKTWFSALFSESENIYVLRSENNEALCLSASDAVFSVADSEIITAVSMNRTPLMMIHSASKRHKGNAEFFNKRGMGFQGKTASDNVSYAKRLLSSERIKGNMTASQEKFVEKKSEKVSDFIRKLH